MPPELVGGPPTALWGHQRMEILPAIDLLGGRCVRLLQGRYDRVIDYEADPVTVAEGFRADGAEWLHVVDLDGARSGRIENLDAVRQIGQQTGLKIQFGGGIRDEVSIQQALDVGAQRVIVGTRALEDWEWFHDLVHGPTYADRLALGLDARLGKLAVRGWTQETERLATDVVRAVRGWPLAAIVYTDIGRDGLLLGPNVHAIEMVQQVAATKVIAAGGVSDLEDVRRLQNAGVGGIVIGRAIYENLLQLRDAIVAATG